MNNKYDDPEKAIKIWIDYLPDLYSEDLVKEGMIIRAQCRTCDSLDARLDMLITNARSLRRKESLFRSSRKNCDYYLSEE